MRQVVAVCRSRKKAVAAAARVLDRYFWRVGDRTWRGRASTACLERVAADLRRVASKNLAVAVHEVGRRAVSHRPLFVVGARGAFGPDGVVPVATATTRRAGGALPGSSAPELILLAAVRLAALFHDLGKASSLFQAKLRGERDERDPVRHEIVSLFVWDALVGEADDAAALVRLRAFKAADVDEAWKAAVAATNTLVKSALAAGTGEVGLGSTSTRAAGDDRRLVRLVGLLVATHHRLYSYGPLLSERGTPWAKAHLSPLAGLVGLTRGDRLLPHHAPPWREPRWLDAVRAAASEAERHLGVLPPGELPGGYAYGRLALMLGDHVASAERSRSRIDFDPASCLANTWLEDGRRHPADPLVVHLLGVARAAHKAARACLRYGREYPFVAHDELPRGLAAPAAIPAAPRFAWQAAAGTSTASFVGLHPGHGFFGCIAAATGTGKTRGAPIVLAAAAAAEADPARRRHRFVAALGLRALAHQTGREYRDDLGFREHEIAVLSGGGLPDREAAAEALEDGPSGSAEDHLEAPVSTEGVPDLTPLKEEEHEGDDGDEDSLGQLSYLVGERRPLPEIVERAVEAARNKSLARRALERPVVVATIDHLMPAADARSGRHLLATLRAATSDLLLDEVDLFEPEDIAAIGRLVFLSGCFGRRVIVASATVTETVVASLAESYRLGWDEHVRLRGGTLRPRIVFGTYSDREDTIRIVLAEDGLGPALDAYRTGVRMVVAHLAASPARRRAEMVEIDDQTGDDTAFDAVGEACRRMHERHAVAIGGLRISAGLVRVANVAACQRLYRRLLSGGVDGVMTRLVCHHARCMWVTRLRREVVLKRMLTRKGGPTRENLALAQELEQRRVLVMARQAGVGDVMVIVVATPVIETGNDVDFDYAIVEPSSVRAIVQTAGRVARHRDLVATTPNIGLLSTTFRGLATGTRAFAYPGVETPPRAPGIQAHQLSSTRLDQLVARGLLEGGVVDARLVLEPDAAGPLALAERRLLGEFLDADVFASPVRFAAAGDVVRFSRAFAENRRFRRDAASRRLFCVPEGLGLQPGWHQVVDPGSGAVSPVQLRAAPVPESAPLSAPLLADEEIVGLGLHMGRRLGLGPPMRLAQLIFGIDVEEYVLGMPEPEFDRLSYEASIGLVKE